MSRFCFSYHLDSNARSSIRKAAESVWGEVVEHVAGPFSLILPRCDAPWSLVSTGTITGAVTGYVRRDGTDIDGLSPEEVEHRMNANFLEELGDSSSWPLGPEWTGSFSAICYRMDRDELLLCNDVLGYLPLYHTREGEGLTGGTHLIPLGRAFRRTPDPAGIAQAITPPWFCNYGRRTVLSAVERLLPGERVCWQAPSAEPECTFDNTLYHPGTVQNLNQVAVETWSVLKKEIKLACGTARTVGIAMSGGWDSRFVLAGLCRQDLRISSYTYGNPTLYESHIARRCAREVGASHQCYPIEGRYFPDREEMASLVRETEAATHMVWCSLRESLSHQVAPQEILLLGDVCEAMDGRNITSLSSREARVTTFLRGLAGLQTRFEDTTSARAEHWKEAMRQKILADVSAQYDNLAPDVASLGSREVVLSATSADLDASLQRVLDTDPPQFAALEEAFAWFHKARNQMATQLLMLSGVSRPMAPTMSLRALRYISSIHPRFRLRKRLWDAIARLPDFDGLARIPSTQIPWLGARAPRLIRDIVWGSRSMADRIMMKATLRRGITRKRQKILRQLDYLQEYRRGGSLDAVQSWFSGRWIRPDAFVDLARARAEFRSWPYINRDLAMPANTSLLLDLCSDTSETPAHPHFVSGEPETVLEESMT